VAGHKTMSTIGVPKSLSNKSTIGSPGGVGATPGRHSSLTHENQPKRLSTSSPAGPSGAIRGARPAGGCRGARLRRSKGDHIAPSSCARKKAAKGPGQLPLPGTPKAAFEADADQLRARSGQMRFVHVDELALFCEYPALVLVTEIVE
jgi:hypothetical protein